MVKPVGMFLIEDQRDIGSISDEDHRDDRLLGDIGPYDEARGRGLWVSKFILVFDILSIQT